MPISTLLNDKLELVSFPEAMRADELLRKWHEHRPQDVYPVLSSDQRLIGLITVDDLSLLSSEPKLVLLTNAVDLMRPPFSVRPQDSLRTALEAMVSYGVREIPVTDEAGHLFGLVDEATFAVAYMQIRSTPKHTNHILAEKVGNS
jgi:CBS domain-containing protein